jgi:hypothetical protein
MQTAGLSPAAARWLRDHHDVAVTCELHRLGLHRKAIDRLCRLGVLRRVSRGVYAQTSARQTLEHRCRTLCCLYPSGFVTGTTAAMLSDLRRQPRVAALQYCVPHGIHLDPMPGVDFRQSTKVAAFDRVVRRDGIVIAAPSRIAFDTARDLRAIDHRSVVHQLLDRKMVTPDELIATGARLCHPARRGSMTFRASLLELGEPQDSHPEVLLLDALVRRGLPVEAQVEVPQPDGVTRHLDIAVPAARWGVELDIHPEHRSVDGHHHDACRRRSLHIAGWQVEPVSELDMVDSAAIERLADELNALLRERCVALGL